MLWSSNKKVASLRDVIHNCPIIDNHAHNLLLPAYVKSYPLQSVTSEAQDTALSHAFSSIPHLRAEKKLRQLYSCSDDANWETILQARDKWLAEKPEALVEKCLEGTHCILMDDGLDGAHQVYRFDRHDRWTKAPTKRIVRIEAVAERLLRDLLQSAGVVDLASESYSEDLWLQFTTNFNQYIVDAAGDSNVAGFKSVICYRTGLDIKPDLDEAQEKARLSIDKFFRHCTRSGNYRIQEKHINDYLVLKTLEILAQNASQDGFCKPIQFHTGLGDNDIDLLRSNPAHMQALIKRCTKVPIVLLHSSYPYTREAGYLATVYHNVFLDIGEVFPMVSREGQISILKQSFEIVPGNKILYSTDGHWFPETYWLANQQFRVALEEVLVAMVLNNDITASEAESLTKNILFNNSNALYQLGHVMNMEEADPKTQKVRGSSEQKASLDPDIEQFLRSIDFMYLQWIDYMAILRTRIIPSQEFIRILKSGDYTGISLGVTGILQDDTVTSAGSTAGQIYVKPDLKTLRASHSKDQLRAALILGSWIDKTGDDIPYCARGALKHLLHQLSSKHSINLLVGFEIEVTFLERVDPSGHDGDPYVPVTNVHSWSTLSPQQWQKLPIFAEMVTILSSIGIKVQQFHAESADGQYEFVLEPLEALTAVDTLIQARQVLAQLAATHGLRATLHPQPYPRIGTAAHAHISLHPPDRDMDFFVGGVLEHIQAICAFSMPQAESYGRVIDDHWTGGTWVAWGTQNRETPLRRVKNGRWEFRCLDGTANMYLALGAIIAAGLLGLEHQTSEFLTKDCSHNPSQLTDDQRRELGITHNLPRSINESLSVLENDVDLREVLAKDVTSKYLTMKKAEQEKLASFSESERRIWLIERY